MNRWRASRSFQPVTARVVRSEALRQPGDSEGEDMATVAVTFRYEADGATHGSQREAFYGGRVFDDWTEAGDHAASFVPGTALRVDVDPDDPSVAVRDMAAPPARARRGGICGSRSRIQRDGVPVPGPLAPPPSDASELLAACLRRLEDEDAEGVAAMLRAHPERARELLRRLLVLAELGLLPEPPAAPQRA